MEVKDAIDINKDNIKIISCRTDWYNIEKYNKIMLLLRKTVVFENKKYRKFFSRKKKLVNLLFKIQRLNCRIKQIARPEFD